MSERRDDPSPVVGEHRVDPALGGSGPAPDRGEVPDRADDLAEDYNLDPEFVQHAAALYRDALVTLLARHHKYGPKNITAAPGGALHGIRVRMHDKLARIDHAIDGTGTLDHQDESFADAWLDVANYALIALMVLRGHWPK